MNGDPNDPLFYYRPINDPKSGNKEVSRLLSDEFKRAFALSVDDIKNHNGDHNKNKLLLRIDEETGLKNRKLFELRKRLAKCLSEQKHICELVAWSIGKEYGLNSEQTNRQLKLLNKF